MALPILRLISSLWWRPPGRVPRRSHQRLKLAGIHQSVFLSEWGFPEVEIALDRMRGIFKPDATFMEARSADEDGYRMWIYRRRNKVLFFIRGTMVSHLSCTEFKERWKYRDGTSDSRFPGKFPGLGASTLSLVA